MEGLGKRKYSASRSEQKSTPRTVNSSSTEADAPSLPAGKKASGKSAKGVRTLQEPLNPNATTTIPTILLHSPVAEATVRQETDDAEAPKDVGYNDMHLGQVQQRDMEKEQVELVRREKHASKERKDGDRRMRDAARLAASLA
jgi:hypothetical protein